jgi:predicted AAA+ superfamily ATPase
LLKNIFNLGGKLMHYEIDIRNFLNKNTAIIGGKETGKTSILKDLVNYFYKQEYIIMLFDSSTKKDENSLLIDSDKKYYHNILIPSPDKEKIYFTDPGSDDYPYFDVNKSNYNIYFFDVSHYLEESYNTSDLEEKELLLCYYKQLVVQELTVMLPVVAEKRAVIIMDEIDFSPDLDNLIQNFNSLNIQVIAAVNKIESLSTSSTLFNVLNLD